MNNFKKHYAAVSKDFEKTQKLYNAATGPKASKEMKATVRKLRTDLHRLGKLVTMMKPWVK